MNSLAIKNLSIALETMSRINRKGSSDLYSRIEDLLKDELRTEETRLPPPQASQADDDIPF